MRNAITPIITLTTDIQDKPEKYHDDNLVETVALIKGQSLDIKRFLDSYHELTHLPSPHREITKATDFISSESVLTHISSSAAPAVRAWSMLWQMSGLPQNGFMFFPGIPFDPPRAGMRYSVLVIG